MQPTRRRLSGRTLAALEMLCAVPALIALGVTVFDDRKYYLISLLIIACTLVPFAVAFERRRPMARELVVIATLVALTVAGRAAFYWAPQIKPVSALVIVAGVCLGAESGLLTGAMSAFLSNFFFGQGPWTPWQMFGFGLIGFLAGVLFRPGALPRGRVALCVYGGLSTLILYGAIVNFGSLLMFGSTALNWAGLLAVYASGLPFDLVHAAATVLFLAILGPAMIEKLERLRRKYGLLETAA